MKKMIGYFLILILLAVPLHCQKEDKVENKTDQLLDYGSFEENERNFSVDLQQLLSRNKAMVEKMTEKDPEYYSAHSLGQKPKYLWIGCSDSRVSPEQIVGAGIGEIFVLRNVANQVHMGDSSAMAIVQYAVEHLGVENIIVAGHYGCGGIKTTFTQHNFGNLESWLYQIRQIHHKYRDQLPEDQKEAENRLVELNVYEQMHRLSRISFVENAWKQGKKLTIMGIVYDLHTGLLKNVWNQIHGFQDIEKEQAFYLDR